MEETFPRGGKHSNFDENNSGTPAAKRRKYSTSAKNDDEKKKKSRGTKRADSPDLFGSLWTGNLRREACIPDLLLLACVRTITDHNVLLELPDGLPGILPLTNVSSIFTEQLLLRYRSAPSSHQGGDKANDIKLSDYFTRGQLICCKVVPTARDVSQKKPRRGTPFVVTTDPRRVNSLVYLATIMEGMVLNGAVKSIEEKGYLVDLGIGQSAPESIGFLPFEQCEHQASDQAKRFRIGQVLSCAVIDAPSAETGSKRVIRLSTLHSRLNGATDFLSKHVQKEQYLPGLVLNGVVEKILPKTGLLVRLAEPGGRCWHGFISKWKLPHPGSRPTDYKPQQSLKVTIVYTMSNSTIFGLSAQTHLTIRSTDEGCRTDLLTFARVGDLVKGQVKRTLKGAVIFDLATGVQGTTIYGKAVRSQLEATDDQEELRYSVGSKHRLRIVGYSLLNRSFNVDARKAIFEQPVVNVESCVPGTLVQATVSKVMTGKGMFVRLYDRFNGFVPLLHCGDRPLREIEKMQLAKKFPSGREVTARILYSDLEKNRIVLTMKRKLVGSSSQIFVNSFNSDFVGQKADGFVAQINPDRGILVAFYGNAKGWLPKVELEKRGLLTADQPVSDLFFVGQSISVQIREVDNAKEKMLLSPIVKEDILMVDLGRQTPTNREQQASEAITVDQKQQFGPDSKANLRMIKPLKKCLLSVGKIFTAIITKIRHLQLDVLIENRHQGRVFVTELSDDFTHGSTPLANFSIGQAILVKVIHVKTKRLKTKKAKPNKLKTSRSEILGGDEGNDKKRFYFADCTMKESKMKAKSGKKKLIGYREEFRKGEKIPVAVEKVASGHDGRGYCCHVAVNPNWKGDIPLLDLSSDANVLKNPVDHFVPGQILLARVAGLQVKEKHLQMTCIPPKKAVVSAGVATSVMVIKVDSKQEKAIKCRLVDGSNGILDVEDHPQGVGLKVGQVFDACPVEKLENGLWRLSLSNRPILKRELSKEHTFESIVTRRRRSSLEEVDVKPALTDDAVAVAVASKRMEQASRFSWDSGRFSMDNLMNVCLNNAEDGSENVEKRGNKRLRLESKSRFERAKLEEDDLLQREMALLNPDRQLESADDFDRLVLGSPDSSLIWIRYMAYFLHRGDVSKAQAVAERALKTINVREENERFNVWTALLNLENTHGTAESFRLVFERALVVNDPLKMYQLATKILRKSKKTQECDVFFNEMLAKFKSEFNVWVSVGDYYMSTQRADKAREIMKRATRSLPSSRQVDLISRFSQLEYRYSKEPDQASAVGDSERGRTLFENILRDCPKRTDIWSVYIDMTSKYQGLNEARPIFERVTSLKLNVHNMRLFYKKWLELEEHQGTKNSLAQVKKRAAEYVQGSLATLEKTGGSVVETGDLENDNME